MLLAIDVGNTQTVLGVYENKKLRYELEQEISWRNRTDSEG